jgi:uncharacterized protein YbjT (DUF2867 family)
MNGFQERGERWHRNRSRNRKNIPRPGGVGYLCLSEPGKYKFTMKKAILFGASGFIGGYLLDELLKDADYEKVTIVVRRNLTIHHPKLEIVIGDYRSLPGLWGNLVADEIFIALGTTKKNTPDRNEYYQADHDYPVLAAKIAKENGAKSVFVVTAVGADANSGIFYIKTKGEVERDIIALDFEHTHIFRPSMLMGNRKEHRPAEKALIRIWSVINRIFIGKLNRYRGIDGAAVAKAMINAAKSQSAKSQSGKVKIYQWKEMDEMLRMKG